MKYNFTSAIQVRFIHIFHGEFHFEIDNIANMMVLSDAPATNIVWWSNFVF